MIIISIFPYFCTEMLKLNMHTIGTSHQILHSLSSEPLCPPAEETETQGEDRGGCRCHGPVFA